MIITNMFQDFMTLNVLQTAPDVLAYLSLQPAYLAVMNMTM